MTQLGQLYEKEKIEYANQKVREKTKEIAKSLLEDGTEIVKIMKVLPFVFLLPFREGVHRISTRLPLFSLNFYEIF